VTRRDSPWLAEIRTLDPERDCRRIVFLDTFCEFPFDTTRALELARSTRGSYPDGYSIETLGPPAAA